MTRASRRGANAAGKQRNYPLILFWIGVAGLAIAMLEFAPRGIGWVGDAGHAAIHVFSDDEPAVSLAVEPRVVNGQPDYGRVANHSVPTRATVPQIDLYVRNKGDETVELGRVKIEVVDSAVLENCIPPQGGGPEEPPFELSYFINLPVSPLPEERIIYRTLHQRVPPEGSGSVNLYLRTLETETLEQIYALRVTLLTGDGGEPVDAGRFVIGLPGPVSRFGSILPENPAAIDDLYPFDSELESTWCYRRNMAAVNRFGAMPGMRSPSMKAIDSARPAPNWSGYADQRPARSAAEALLEPPGFIDLPSLAVFAAERTGDRRFVSGVEERATAILLAAAEEQMSTSPRRAVLEARAALKAEDSPEGREILALAEAGLRELEDVSGELSG